MGYRAVARFIRVSPTKVRRVASEVRLQKYNDAIALLSNLPHKGAYLLKKVIESAAANALHANNNFSKDMLYISELYVNEGPRMKRLWARGRGRAGLLLKRMSHITAVVDVVKEQGR